MLSSSLVTSPMSVGAEHDRIIILPYKGSDIRRNHYLEDVLTASLRKVGVGIEIKYHSIHANQSRLQKMLVQGEGIDVAWMPVTKERLDELKVVPIGLYGGLHGNRVLLIRADRQPEFSEIHSLADLSKFVALQNRHWSEYTVLQHNGLKVMGDLTFSQMFRALSENMGDYFPRSVLIVEKELEEYPQWNLAIEQDLLLVYPSFYAFFVASTEPKLHQQLTKGLTELAQSGELKKIFERYHGDAISGLELSSRRVLSLSDPNFEDNKPEHIDINWIAKSSR